MTDFVEDISRYMRDNFVHFDTNGDEKHAQAIRDLIIARIPPLVWKTEGCTVFSAKGYVVIKDDLSGLYRFSPDGEKLSVGYERAQTAKAAANAHHVAQLCKGMGIE